jgi:hypothetical protein
MPKRNNASSGRPPPPGTSPVGAKRAKSGGAASAARFTALSDPQWEAIRSTRKNWPEGIDWRREIERIGQDYWYIEASRKMWVNKLRGKQRAKQRKKVRKASILMRQLQNVLAELADDGLLGDDFPHPEFKWPELRLEEWLTEYDHWVRSFPGQSNPIQVHMESMLMRLWKRSGGKLSYSRKKDDPGTPYGPLVDFLTRTLEAFIGKTLKPSGVAKLIDRHRGRKNAHVPFLMHAMRTLIEIGSMPWDEYDPALA